MTTTNHNTVAKAAGTLPWPAFAAAYRDSLAAYEASIKDTDEDDAEHDTHKAAYEALLSYPVTTPQQLAEKAELIVADCWDDGQALGVLAADALIAARGPDGPDGLAWRAAVAAYEAARDAYNPHGPSEGTGSNTEEEIVTLWEAYLDAWRAMIDCPAPDAAATAYKVAAFVDVAYSELLGDSASDPDTLRRLLQDGSLPGTRSIVRFMQDASRQAGLSHPCLAVGLAA